MAIKLFTRLATLGCILKVGSTALHIFFTAGPLTRTTAIALVPGGVAWATIVNLYLSQRQRCLRYANGHGFYDRN